MNRFAWASRAVRPVLIEHFELCLTAAGVLITIGLIFSNMTRGEQGVTTAFLIWLQGFIIWAVHRHASFGRRALVEKLRLMLQDRVNNQLTVILGATEIRDRELTAAEKRDMDAATVAARKVAYELETLSLEALGSWSHRYRYFVRGMLR